MRLLLGVQSGGVSGRCGVAAAVAGEGGGVAAVVGEGGEGVGTQPAGRLNAPAAAGQQPSSLEGVGGAAARGWGCMDGGGLWGWAGPGLARWLLLPTPKGGYCWLVWAD